MRTTEATSPTERATQNLLEYPSDSVGGVAGLVWVGAGTVALLGTVSPAAGSTVGGDTVGLLEAREEEEEEVEGAAAVSTLFMNSFLSTTAVLPFVITSIRGKGYGRADLSIDFL